MKHPCALFLVLIPMSLAIETVPARALQPGRVELYCHRTDNEEVPENTLESLEQAAAMQSLEELAFGPMEEFSQENGLVAGFELWDRIGTDPSGTLRALASSNGQVADRAEWILVQGGPSVLPQVRNALQNENASVRARVIRILAWQGDESSLPALKAMRSNNSAGPELIDWATEKIESLHPNM